MDRVIITFHSASQVDFDIQNGGKVTSYTATSNSKAINSFIYAISKGANMTALNRFKERAVISAKLINV